MFLKAIGKAHEMTNQTIALGEFNFNEAEINGPRMLFYSDTGHKLYLNAATRRIELLDPGGRALPVSALNRTTLEEAQSYLAIWCDEYESSDDFYDYESTDD